MNTRTIVTGSSSNHFPCLQNLLYTVRALASDAHTVVFDLGLTDRERNALTADRWEVRRFEFAKYPPHVNIAINRGEYAWKPIIIHTMLEEFGGLVLWLDAGDLVLADLNPIWDAIAKNGLLSVLSGATIRDWTHPGTLAYLQVPEEDLGQPNRAGGLIGISGDHEWARRLCAQWRACALCKECIAPKGSSRKNHRQDQAVLSVLYYQYHRAVGFPAIDRVRQIAIHNDDLHPGDVQLLLRSGEVRLRSLTLVPEGGVGDRLLALASAARLCALTRAACAIAWNTGDFRSMLRPPKGMTWTSAADSDAKAHDHTLSLPGADGLESRQIPISAHDRLLLFASGPFHAVGEDRFARIDRLRKWLPQPSEELLSYVRSIVAVLPHRTAGMHIPREYPIGRQRCSPLDSYFRIADELIEQNMRIFLVAEDPEVARQMTTRFGDNIRQCSRGDWPMGQATVDPETRSLALEFVEFFMLARCEYVIGDARSHYGSLAILYNGSSHCQVIQHTSITA